MKLKGSSIDDSQGNGNGIMDPGETVEVTVTVKNDGAYGVDQVKAYYLT
jgi:hypothetical protein